MEELSWHDRGRLWIRLGIRLILTLVVAAFLVLAGPYLLSLLFPFVLALLLAWMLNPAVRFIQKRIGISRRVLSLLLILLLFALAGGLLFVATYNIVIEIRNLINNWQAIWGGFLLALEQIGGFTDRFFTYLPPEVGVWTENLMTKLVEWLQTVIPTLLSGVAAGAGSWAMKVPSFAVGTIVFIMGSYFITADYPHIRYLVVERMSADTLGLLRFIKHTAAAALGGYVKAQFILSVGVFFILIIGFSIIGQSYAFLLALLLAVMDFIPIIGAGTVMVPWAVISLFTDDLRTAVELMVIWGVILLFRRIGEPKAVGNQTGLSPVLSLVSIYVGMQVAGVGGMIFGPVVFLVVINVCKAGVFDGLVADVKLALKDTRALLKNRP